MPEPPPPQSQRGQQYFQFFPHPLTAGRPTVTLHATAEISSWAPHSRTHALAAIVILTLNVLASTSFAQHPALSRLDLDGDGVADRVYTYPDGFPNPAPGQSPGEVHEVSGATNDTLVRFIGETPGDRFGFSVAYAGDRQRDGNVDLLIGAPSVNAVYVFDGPFKFMCPVPVELVSADKASMKVIRTDMSEWDFGYAVAGGYDYRGDGYPSFRVGARYLDNGQTRTREYIFHGYIGLPLARIHRVSGDGGQSLLGRPAGDVVGHAQVTTTDAQIILENIGADGGVNDGDVDGDAVVGLSDLVIAVEQQGVRLYDPASSSPPTGVSCSNDVGCEAYLARDGDDWYCVERMGLGCVEPMAATEPSCEEQILQCYQNPSLALQNALQLVTSRCGGMSAITFRCESCAANPSLCNDDTGGKTIPICVGSERRIEIIICQEATDKCITYAHELVHASQACAFGLLDSAIPCSVFAQKWNNQYHRMCMEREAYELDGECQGISECCESACDSVGNIWQDAFCSCVQCCTESVNCCLGGRNICLDTGQDPCWNGQ